MNRYAALFVLVGIVCLPFAVSAAESTTAKAPTCSEQSGGSTTTAGGQSGKTQIQQIDKTSIDQVVLTKTGQVSVVSQCNPQCKNGKLIDAQGAITDKPCPPGTVTMHLEKGQSVTCSKAEEACGKAIEKATQSPDVASALSQGDVVEAAKAYTKELFSQPGFKEKMSQSTQNILDAAFAGQTSAESQALKNQISEGSDAIWDALADGNPAQAAAELQKVQPLLENYLKDPENFKTLQQEALSQLPPEARQSLANLINQVCQNADCPPDIAQTFGPVGGPAAKQLVPRSDTLVGGASTYNPNLPGWRTGGQALATGGRYNPNEYEAALQLDLAKAYGVGYGSGKVGYALVEAGDNKLVVRINDNGPLVGNRIIDLNEASMRYLSDGRYGNNSGVLSNVKVTLLQGEQTPGPITAPIDLGTRLVAPSLGSYVRAGSSASPFSVASSFFGGGGGATGFGGSSLYGGGYGAGSSASPFSGMFSRFTGGGGSGSGNYGGGYSGGYQNYGGYGGGYANQPVQGDIAPTTPTTPTVRTTPLSDPIITLSYPKSAIAKGTSFTILWAAVNVGSTPSCRLFEVSGSSRVLRAEGSALSYRVATSAATAGTLSYELVCVPADTRVAAGKGVKAFTVRVQ